jgi:hypothetical protein
MAQAINVDKDKKQRAKRTARQRLAISGVRDAGRAANAARELIECGSTPPADVSDMGAAFFAAVQRWNNDVAESEGL